MGYTPYGLRETRLYFKFLAHDTSESAVSAVLCFPTITAFWYQTVFNYCTVHRIHYGFP